MSRTIRIRSPRSRRALALAATLLPLIMVAALLTSLWSDTFFGALVLATLPTSLLLYSCWQEFVENNRIIEIRIDEHLVAVARPSPFRQKIRTFPTDQFSSVIAYRSWDLPNPFHVELRTSDGCTGILLSSFLPQDQPDSRFKSEDDFEPEYCQRLREEVASGLKLERTEFIKTGLPFWRRAKETGLIYNSIEITP